mmetsp:Transcript_115109/g.229248  ORF Transcript_115109/g.229248 Transcript_115109/m.229248 type:complete len:384 (-) Transcript_115109:75-1226(-)|eukprot:CAMPEP_0172719652 /NCGR_PEP_ID=MMETSP1074-20121228/75629_1 /TAXON_ID=2916 /ORGANISM="Ceratium fusus, Strain PA161109" /LENGTH=383 /DNA_ID=CAMNT_0013545031 /DNA_START=73 /DNA_END=1224 /DNA_ORIENTATION=-
MAPDIHGITDGSLAAPAEDSIASFIVQALARHGWDGVDISCIKVDNCSGNSGCGTYKVSCDEYQAPVVLHVHSKRTATDPELEERLRQIGAFFAMHGLGPRRLASGADWCIEPWAGSGKPKFDDIEKWKELGCLIARIHSIPTTWFEGWKQKVYDARPVMRELPQSSHIWCFVFNGCGVWKMDEAIQKAWLHADFFAPTSAPARRIVTSHLDLHPGNMIQTSDGILCIDLDYACVTSAAQDLAFTFCWASAPWNRNWEGPAILGGPAAAQTKRAFLVAYLEASGLPAEQADIDALYIDAEVMSLCGHSGTLMGCWYGFDIPGERGTEPWLQERARRWQERFTFYKEAVDAIRASAALQADILGGLSLDEVIGANFSEGSATGW